MSLKRIGPNGQMVEVTSAPYPATHKRLLKQLSGQQLKELNQFIRDSIKYETQLTVATKFGNVNLTWQNVPLIYLLKIARGNEQLAGELLGLILMDIIIEDNRPWKTIKTIVGRRDFETNFYFRAA